MGVSSHPHLWVAKSASLLGLIVTLTLAVNAGTISRLSGRGSATLTGCEDSTEMFHLLPLLLTMKITYQEEHVQRLKGRDMIHSTSCV